MAFSSKDWCNENFSAEKKVIGKIDEIPKTGVICELQYVIWDLIIFTC